MTQSSVIDDQGKILTVNPAAVKLFGYASGELLGTDVAILLPSNDPETQNYFFRDFNRNSIDPFAAVNREALCRRKDGSNFPVEISVSSVDLRDKRIFSGILRDLTERKEVDKIKSEFISVVSHELRTPLTSIKGSLDLVAGGITGELPEAALNLIKVACENTRRLSILINDILDIEKFESGNINLTLARQALLPLIKKSVEANAGYADEFNISLVITASPEEDTFINVDADRMMQVMANLISNAVKFSPRSAAVEISAERSNGTVRISVKDYGQGVPENFKSKIFTKFSQADSSAVRAHAGTGLGLSITKMIIEKMNGSIGFDSEPGHGATFYIDVPVMP